MNSGRRMCNFTMRPIEARDRASVQIVLAQLDSNGRSTGVNDIVDVCGSIRKSGEVDSYLLDYSRNNQ